MRTRSSVPFAEVGVTGPFWRERLETVLARTIPSQLRMQEAWDIRGSIRLPKPMPPLTRPRGSDGFAVQVPRDSDVGRWIEVLGHAVQAMSMYAAMAEHGYSGLNRACEALWRDWRGAACGRARRRTAPGTGASAWRRSPKGRGRGPGPRALPDGATRWRSGSGGEAALATA